jgi:aryl-alcohol dehydrogenase-like predicted oxidoreductase
MPGASTLNRTDANPFPLGLGTSKLRSLSGGLSSRQAVRLLEAALDEGIRWFDTAPSYGQGQAESAIGLLPTAKRQQAIICTKVGHHFGRKAWLVNAVKPVLQPVARYASAVRKLLARSRENLVDRGAIRVEIDPSALRANLTDSLRRLRREQTDVFLLHDPSPKALNAANEQALEALRTEGLIGRWGVCTGELDVAREALSLTNLSVLQLPVDADWAHAAGDLFAQAQRQGVLVMGHRVLLDLARTGASASAAEREAAVRQCYAHALALPGLEVALCGTTSLEHLKNNVRLVRQLVAERTREMAGRP